MIEPGLGLVPALVAMRSVETAQALPEVGNLFAPDGGLVTLLGYALWAIGGLLVAEIGVRVYRYLRAS